MSWALNDNDIEPESSVFRDCNSTIFPEGSFTLIWINCPEVPSINSDSKEIVSPIRNPEESIDKLIPVGMLELSISVSINSNSKDTSSTEVPYVTDTV